MPPRRGHFARNGGVQTVYFGIVNTAAGLVQKMFVAFTAMLDGLGMLVPRIVIGPPARGTSNRAP